MSRLRFLISNFFSKLRVRVPRELDDVAGLEGGGDIDQTLVARATEHQVKVALGRDERAIDRHRLARVERPRFGVMAT